MKEIIIFTTIQTVLFIGVYTILTLLFDTIADVYVNYKIRKEEERAEKEKNKDCNIKVVAEQEKVIINGKQYKLIKLQQDSKYGFLIGDEQNKI